MDSMLAVLMGMIMIVMFHKTHNVVIMSSQPCGLPRVSRSGAGVSPLSLQAQEPGHGSGLIEPFSNQLFI